ncbi:MAG: hypothetical protein IPH57_06915 [Saprospiraceae bacterium]|nr:hypothetical protein [Saprospiraceae bacterium]
MKILSIFLTIFTASIFINSCNVTKSTSEIVVYSDNKDQNSEKLAISLIKGKGFNHPTYVIWMEDECGKYIKTLFVTKSYASGIFGHQMVGDSVWLKTSGVSYQPAALPYWTFRKGLINGKSYIPDPNNPFVDAFTGATPKSDFRFETNKSGNSGEYRILLEVNQAWDWNQYWTNNKFPDSPAYKHSAQPSVIYEVSVNNENTEFYLNPIGHGDPKGETGTLYSNLGSLTSAKEIFSSVKVEIIK